MQQMTQALQPPHKSNQPFNHRIYLKSTTTTTKINIKIIAYSFICLKENEKNQTKIRPDIMLYWPMVCTFI